VGRNNHQAKRYVVFFTPLLLRPFEGPNVFLSTLFSNPLSLGSYLNMKDQVSHPHKT